MGFIDILGCLGSLIVLLAYHYNSKESDSDKTFKYQIANIIGGLILAVYSFEHSAYASMASNIIWILISLNSLKSFIKKKLLALTTIKKGVSNEKIDQFSIMSR